MGVKPIPRYLVLSVCVCGGDTEVHMWRSEDNFQGLVLPHHVGSGDLTQVVGLGFGGKCLRLLSSVPGP